MALRSSGLASGGVSSSYSAGPEIVIQRRHFVSILLLNSDELKWRRLVEMAKVETMKAGDLVEVDILVDF